MAKLTSRQTASIRFSCFLKWILGFPIQIWRIPYSLFLMGKNIIKFFEKGMAEPELGIALGWFFVVLGVYSAFSNLLIFGITLGVFYFSFLIYAFIHDCRDGYRIKYNEIKNLADWYDEYEARFGEPDEDEGDEYFYYYKNSGFSGDAGKNFNSGQSSYGSRNRYSGSSADGSANTYSKNNMFMGLKPDVAKDKYRELMKKYHPDNKETGDAEKAKDIIAQYEEYEELIK